MAEPMMDGGKGMPTAAPTATRATPGGLLCRTTTGDYSDWSSSSSWRVPRYG
jgi:hypothetical protein